MSVLRCVDARRLSAQTNSLRWFTAQTSSLWLRERADVLSSFFCLSRLSCQAFCIWIQLFHICICVYFGWLSVTRDTFSFRESAWEAAGRSTTSTQIFYFRESSNTTEQKVQVKVSLKLKINLKYWKCLLCRIMFIILLDNYWCINV